MQKESKKQLENHQIKSLDNKKSTLHQSVHFIDPKHSETHSNLESSTKIQADTNELEQDSMKLVPLSRSDFDMKTLENWCEIRAKNQPKRRSFQTGFFYNDYLYIVAGIDLAAGKLNDIKRINLNGDTLKWEEVNPLGVILEPLAYHAGCCYENLYYIIGGQNSKMQSVNSIYIYDIENNQLEKIIPKENDFLPVENHSVCLYNHQIIIFGGFSHGHFQNVIYSFDIQTKTFKKITPEDNVYPIGRTNHSALVYKDELYIFGGITDDCMYLNDMWKFNLNNSKWSKIEYSSDDMPEPRSGHSMVVNGDEFILFGGKIGNMGEKNDLWKFNPLKSDFNLLHDTMIQKFTDKELEEFLPIHEDESKKVKPFKILTKKDIPALNPLKKSKNHKKEKTKKNEMMRKSQQLFEFRQNMELELLRSPSINLMKKSIIYNLDTDISTAINRLNTLMHSVNSDRNHSNKDLIIIGVPPLPRDGHSALLYENRIFIFGGDRNKFPFNDLYSYIL